MKMRLLTFCLSLSALASLFAQEMPAPSPEHKIVQIDVGEWTIESKMMMPEGIQPFKADEQVVLYPFT
jgi:uncharacterized protein involved in high-affinity Fe2+ transport